MLSNRRLNRVLFSAAAWSLALGASGAVAQPPQEDLRSFVRADFYHGLPADEGLRYGSEAVPRLLEMLADEDERVAWPNIVHLLGLLGDPRGAEPLIEFLENRFAGPVDNTTYRALVQIPKSLGLMATSPDGRAYRYLEEGLSIESWQSRGLEWSYPTVEEAQRTTLLRKLAVGGLGLSGAPQAAGALEALRDRLERGSEAWSSSLLPAVNEALLTQRVVQRHGRQALFDGRFASLVASERGPG